MPTVVQSSYSCFAMVSRALAQTVSGLPVALVALPQALSRKGTSCQTQTASGLCRQIETASFAVQSLRALQELCDKCKRAKTILGVTHAAAYLNRHSKRSSLKGDLASAPLSKSLWKSARRSSPLFRKWGTTQRRNGRWELRS